MLYLRECWADAKFVTTHSFHFCRYWRFPLPTEQPETCLERPIQGCKHPNYILSKMLMLSTFIQDSQSLCVQWAKDEAEGIISSETTWSANHAEGSSWGYQPRNGILYIKPHFLPLSLPNTQAGIGSFWQWEWSCLMLYLWVLLPYFLSQNSRCMTNTAVLMATKGQAILKTLWKI